MKASMPKVGAKRRSKPSWWMEDITISKKRLLSFRRKCDYKVQRKNEYRVLRN